MFQWWQEAKVMPLAQFHALTTETAQQGQGAGHLAPGTWHLAPGTWHLPPGTWHLEQVSCPLPSSPRA